MAVKTMCVHVHIISQTELFYIKMQRCHCKGIRRRQRPNLTSTPFCCL